jgi:hypothetical protein
MEGRVPDEADENSVHEAEQRASDASAAKEAAEKRADDATAAQKEAEQLANDATAAQKEAEQLARDAQEAQHQAEQRAKQEAEARVRAEERAETAMEKAKKEAALELEKRLRQQGVALSANQVQEQAKAGIPWQIALLTEWQSSSARAEAQALVALPGGLALLSLLGAIPLVILTATGDLLVPVGVSTTAFCFLIAIGAGAWGVHWYAARLSEYLKTREEALSERERDKQQKAKRQTQEAASKGTQENDALDELLNLNRTQMQAYQTLSRGQQRSSFRYSLIALFIGLFVLVAGVVVVVTVQADIAKVAVASVTALGSALSSYIASTYLRLHRQTGDQLRYFYAQPLVASYIYEAERVVGELEGSTAKKPMYETVIKHILRVAGRAQTDVLTFTRAQASGRHSQPSGTDGRKRGFRRKEREREPTGGDRA